MNPSTGQPERAFLVKFSDKLLQISPAYIFAVAYAMVAGIAASDITTGYWMSLSRFHVLPIALVSWARGRRPGIVIALVSGLVWAGTDIIGARTFQEPVIPIWNALVRLSILVAGSVILSALREALQQEKTMARTDFLTDVANRRHFFELANAEIRRCKRYRHAFIVAYLDIDGFKNVNDRFGHNQGDALLRLVARTIRTSVREVDIVARVGGDEFAILFPETDSHVSSDVMKKVQANLMRAMKDNSWPVTFSIGTVTYVSPPVSVDEMIKKADTLMYSVKNSGKNTIHYDVFDRPGATEPS